MVPLMRDPDLDWKEAVFSEWKHGEAVKTDRYLYTEWHKNGEVVARMLYDHKIDPEENVNVAGDPDYAKVVETMHQWIADGWKKAEPKA